MRTFNFIICHEAHGGEEEGMKPVFIQHVCATFIFSCQILLRANIIFNKMNNIIYIIIVIYEVYIIFNKSINFDREIWIIYIV